MKSRWIGGLLLVVFCAVDTAALTDEAIFRDIRFHAVTPGARTLGMGGAGTATVDDATAVGINPAALQSIDQLVVLGELRHSDGDSQSTDRSVGSADVTGPRFPYVQFGSDSRPDLEGAAGFLGAALPIGGRAVLGFSRQIVLDQSNHLDNASLEFALDDFPIWINPTGSGGPALEQYSVANFTSGMLSTELVHYNAAFSMPLSSVFSVGATVTFADLDVRSSIVNLTDDPLGYLERPNNPRADLDGDSVPDQIETRSQIDGGDSALAYTIGVHFHPGRVGPVPLQVGARFSKGADLEVKQVRSQIDPATGQIAIDPSTFAPIQDTFMNTFRAPDRWALGVAAKPARNWLLAIDVERVEYSDLLDDFRSGTDLLTSGFIDPAVLQQSDSSQVARFDIDDATIVRLGAEYRLARGSWSIGFRGGFYNDPESGVRLSQFNSDSSSINEAFQETLDTGDDDEHFTAGVSAAAPTGLELHLAADFSDFADRFLVSVAWRTGMLKR